MLTQTSNQKNSRKIQIAVFGSAFNPPTLGHLSVLKRLAHFDQVLLVPSIAHAWGKHMAPFEFRCQLVADFLTDVQLDNACLSTVEANLCQQQRATHPQANLLDSTSNAAENISVTTFELLSHLQRLYPDAELTFVIGPDNLLNFHKFSRHQEILSRWSVLTCPESLTVRSTDIRTALNHGNAIDELTTPSVIERLKKANSPFKSL